MIISFVQKGKTHWSLSDSVKCYQYLIQFQQNIVRPYSFIFVFLQSLDKQTFSISTLKEQNEKKIRGRLSNMSYSTCTCIFIWLLMIIHINYGDHIFNIILFLIVFIQTNHCWLQRERNKPHAHMCLQLREDVLRLLIISKSLQLNF